MSLSARKTSRCGLRCVSFFALLLFLSATAHSSAAQQVPASAPPAVTGIVRTSEGTPVPGATVRLINNDTNKVWLSWTDESGKFEFPQIAAGHYRIEASQLGFTQASLTIDVPVIPAGPVPIVLRVATLAELSAMPGKPTSNQPRPRGNGQGNSQANNQGNGQNHGQNAQNNARGNGQYRRGAGGQGQLPAGVANALREGLAGGGFEQTDLTGEGPTPQTAENSGATNEGPQAEAALANANNSNATSDSFLLQGTVGQSLASNGPGGFGPGGLGARHSGRRTRRSRRPWRRQYVRRRPWRRPWRRRSGRVRWTGRPRRRWWWRNVRRRAGKVGAANGEPHSF